ncbi:histidinol phosphate aminotransferase apoenzyme [Tissierella praeacuta DSM 18095]|uniref:Histidinol-phosphate aminotransferase n=1 Tax=Tissierella praeacuta DSM 18095 TaxID=1123404 RepID=A0A1M4XZF8_9FIRM|nr:histidinol-phosphate transaminase [Tissierella praeacuta]TCU69747.1 histidinol-phosphate aminotransferase [Tissierella praeacuta]SHE98825.1 histidinol phosphate aminotransferase apoenzyme [Tissierella praeacuta DSM 18095]SUP03376.1 Histidinol-phosphate aminotransferase 2 [Tissierella praeacuta]
MSIDFRNEIRNLEPYRPGKPIKDVKREYNLNKVIKLASNENPLGCSPKVKEAIINTLDELAIYPDGNSTELKETLASTLGIDVNEILPSGGSDEMIDLIAKTYIDKDDEIIMADITFPRYIQTTEMMGGTPIIVPLKEFTFDLKGILERITNKTKIIWICNPNNPTGTMITEKEFVDFITNVPPKVLVISDEAYREYVTRDDYPFNTVELSKKHPNLLVMRTFSKAYGLAGIRVAYTIGNKDILENINKVRGPFNVNILAQSAAIAAIKDTEFLKKSYKANLEGKNYLYSEFDKLGFNYAPSETNHIFVNVGRNGQEVFLELQKRGVIIRPMKGDFIRVSIGTMEENSLFIEKLKEVLL